VGFSKIEKYLRDTIVLTPDFGVFIIVLFASFSGKMEL
jgi:hypothetical protein